MEKQKEFRRIVGFIVNELSNLGLENVTDPRVRRGQRWRLKQVIAACIFGMMAGCKGLAELEHLTATFSRGVRKKLGIPRRLPDTTARDILCRIDPAALREVLVRVVAKAKKGRRFDRSVDLPFHVAAMDGKWSAIPSWAGDYAQRRTTDSGAVYGMIRTVTTTLATAEGRPCIDVSAVPSSTNEMGHYQHALGALLGKHGRLLGMVSYDQGANSEENARFTLAQGVHYLMRMNDERRDMQQVVADILASKEVVAESEDVIGHSKVVRRTLRIVSLNNPGFPKSIRKSPIWDHARTFLRVDSETTVGGKVTEGLSRYYASSLPREKLREAQWLMLPRLHWAVELTHQTLDRSFREDDRPWVTHDPNGMLVALILRRIAYTLLTMYRSVTQRSDDKRLRPWNEMFQWVRDALTSATEATIRSLRRRKAVVIN